jgi:cysteine-rich repeat protein
MRRLGHALFGTAAMLVVAVPASAQLCDPAANPCVVSANVTVPSGTVVDIGTRDLVIASSKTLTVSGLGILVLLAHDVTLETDAKIVADGQDGFGGDVTIDATGAVLMQSGSIIDVRSASAGDIDITGASFQLDGLLRADATTRDGDGGLVGITTTFDTTIAGAGIAGDGGDRFSCGGYIDVLAGGDVTVSAEISVKGGDCDAGDIDLEAGGDVVTTATGLLTSFGTYPFASGGDISFTAGGVVTIGGAITAHGQGDQFEGGGDGGDLDVIADGGDVRVNALLDFAGAAPDGSGGFLDIFASGQVQVNAALSVGSGREGDGGDVLIDADSILVNAPMDLQAGFDGGDVDLSAVADITFTAAGDVNVSTTFGPYGDYGGIISVVGCSVDVEAGAEFLAIGDGTRPRASILLTGTHELRIAGTLEAGATIELRYKDALPIFVPGFVVIPTPTQIYDTSLPCCVACNTTTTVIGTTTTTLISMGCGDGVLGPGEQCDDGNPFDGDCCSSTCTFEGQGQPCADDGNVCTSDVCNGLGVCIHSGDNPGTVCRPPANACDAAETCTGFSPECPPDEALPNGATCDDDACLDAETCTDGICGGGVPVVCPACESCDSAVGCVAAPRSACLQTVFPGKSTLVLKDSTSDAKDKLVWKWRKGASTTLADYGDPLTTSDFELCFFDESTGTPVVVGSARMPAGGMCAGTPCWRDTSSGYKYASKLGTPDGVAKMILRAGDDGQALALVKGKGALLHAPSLPLGVPTRVQLRGGDACWEATFSAAGTKRSTDTVYKGLSD